MAATVEVRYFTGASPGITGTVWPANGRYDRSDSVPTTDGSTNAIPIPAAGSGLFANSWRRWTKIFATVAPTGTISNLRWYDGTSWGTGVKNWVKSTPDASYVQASAADESLGTAVYTDASTLTLNSPLVVNAGTVISATGTGGAAQNYVESFLRVDETATQGLISGHTLVYRWDET